MHIYASDARRSIGNLLTFHGRGAVLLEWLAKRILTFALVALLAETPEELLAEGAERWLAEELGHELVAVDFVRPAREEPCSIEWVSDEYSTREVTTCLERTVDV